MLILKKDTPLYNAGTKVTLTAGGLVEYFSGQAIFPRPERFPEDTFRERMLSDGWIEEVEDRKRMYRIYFDSLDRVCGIAGRVGDKEINLPMFDNISLYSHYKDVEVSGELREDLPSYKAIAEMRIEALNKIIEGKDRRIKCLIEKTNWLEKTLKRQIDLPMDYKYENFEEFLEENQLRAGLRSGTARLAFNAARELK